MFWTAKYNSGTVTNGSSGSALFNENGQVIGQLRGGWSSCNFTDFGDRYGKFHHSWNNAGLQQWLSPSQGLQSTGLLNLTNIPINGPNSISCTTPQQYSTLPGLLDVTYTWTVSAGLQILSGQGTANVTISGFPNNQFGSGTLTLTLASPTKGRTRTYTVSKAITIGTGGNGSITGTYNSPTSETEPLSPVANNVPPPVNPSCIAFSTNMTLPANSTVSWAGTTSSPQVSWYQSGDNIWCYFTTLGQTATFTATITNSCGTFTESFLFECVTYNSCGIIAQRVALSPNPATSSLLVALEEKGDKTKKRDISELRVLDKLGNVKLTRKYGKGQKNVSLDVSALPADVYTIMVHDGKDWTTEKFIKN